MYLRALRNVGACQRHLAFNHQIRKFSVIICNNIEEPNRSIGLNKSNRNKLNRRSILLDVYQPTRNMTTMKHNLHYEFIRVNDKPEIIEFLKRNFYADEPLTQYIKLLDNPKSVKVLSDFSTKSIIENMSILARTESGEIAGISLNSVKSKNDPEGEPITDFLFGKIAKLLAFAYKDSKVFEKYPDIDCVMSVDIISVDRKFQGHGIAKVLMDKTRNLAREKGIKMIRVDCTSHFSARASEKLGMECVYELKYADYKVNGVQVFNPDPPHTGLKVYVQRLTDSKL